MGKLDTAVPGMNAYVYARTTFMDNLFIEALQNEISQVVLMGAGYNSRPYRFAGINHNSLVFELDIAPTQVRKKECLRKARIEIPAQVRFVPVNFNQGGLGDALDKARFELDEKTLFIWEGVSYYLDPKSVEETLDFVSRSNPESGSRSITW